MVKNRQFVCTIVDGSRLQFEDGIHHEISSSRDFPPHNSAVFLVQFLLFGDELTTLFTLVGGDWNMFYDFPYTGNIIIPTGELIFFRGVGIPATSTSLENKTLPGL